MNQCEECGMPLDQSGDELGLPPVESDGRLFCGVQCLSDFANRVTEAALSRVPAINLEEALRMREVLR